MPWSCSHVTTASYQDAVYPKSSTTEEAKMLISKFALAKQECLENQHPN